MSENDPGRADGASTRPDTARPGSGLDPERWVERHADRLFRYALSRVGSRELAEDLVQDTLFAAWRSAERFEGRASESTWLSRILRNKITDHYRKKRPEFAVEDTCELARLEEQQFQQDGLHSGGWSHSGAPGHWKDTSQAVEHAEFWTVLQRCTEKLPEHNARVFLLREVDGRTSDEICSLLNINRNHLGVMLHRARLAIRRCLELHWFRDPT